MNNIIQFLNSYDKHYKSTIEFCSELKEMELLTPFNLQILLNEDKPLRLEGLFIIDEKKLTGISEEKVKKWFDSGWLAWIYAHLHSLGALKRLVKRQKES